MAALAFNCVWLVRRLLENVTLEAKKIDSTVNINMELEKPQVVDRVVRSNKQKETVTLPLVHNNIVYPEEPTYEDTRNWRFFGEEVKPKNKSAKVRKSLKYQIMHW